MIPIFKLSNAFREEKIAEWIHRKNGSDDFVFCSHCNTQSLNYLMDSGYYKNHITKYCPQCGYRMKYKGVLL